MRTRGTVLTVMVALILMGASTLLLTKASATAPIEPERGALTGAGTTIFSDDFNGSSIDTTKWDAYHRISDQVNQELNCVVPENISISDGLLSGITEHEDHTCGDSQQAPVLEHYTSW